MVKGTVYGYGTLVHISFTLLTLCNPSVTDTIKTKKSFLYSFYLGWHNVTHYTVFNIILRPQSIFTKVIRENILD